MIIGYYICYNRIKKFLISTNISFVNYANPDKHVVCAEA